MKNNSKYSKTTWSLRLRLWLSSFCYCSSLMKNVHSQLPETNLSDWFNYCGTQWKSMKMIFPALKLFWHSPCIFTWYRQTNNLLKASVTLNYFSFLYISSKSFRVSAGELSFIFYFSKRHKTQGYLWGLPRPRCQALEHSSSNIWPFGELHRHLCTQLRIASGDVT